MLRDFFIPKDYGRQEHSDAQNEQGGEDEIRKSHASGPLSASMNLTFY
jgi:hypothetical protein